MAALERRWLTRALLAGMAVALGSCASPPADYRPRYALITPAPGYGPGRAAQGAAVVPEACLSAEPAFLETAGPLLPPGCANAYNLAEMVERRSDLLHGRRLAPAPAAPTARAARRYIDGDRPRTPPAPPSAADVSTDQPGRGL
ncbi:hypothetical protein ACFQU1_17760 [Chelatococcus sp. GCM10030263]|uniref:hypothetical protein n=1 Tax=Chelatococcus sp. GCM10030263 TaxID=3273387 RepID=UPI003623990E